LLIGATGPGRNPDIPLPRDTRPHGKESAEVLRCLLVSFLWRFSWGQTQNSLEGLFISLLAWEPLEMPPEEQVTV